MSDVRLVGVLRCRDAAESEAVRAHLPTHIALTRAERGCLHFEVRPTDDPLVWAVEERFADAESFTAHQQRTADSEWGAVTRGIPRQYEIVGL